jgi:hypothetical protein
MKEGFKPNPKSYWQWMGTGIYLTEDINDAIGYGKYIIECDVDLTKFKTKVINPFDDPPTIFDMDEPEKFFIGEECFPLDDNEEPESWGLWERKEELKNLPINELHKLYKQKVKTDPHTTYSINELVDSIVFEECWKLYLKRVREFKNWMIEQGYEIGERTDPFGVTEFVVWNPETFKKIQCRVLTEEEVLKRIKESRKK